MKDTCEVIVKTDFEALHFWEEAESFLKFPHYHRFFVELRISTVPGDMNRSLEFFAAKAMLGCAIRNMLLRHALSPSILPKQLRCDTLGYEVVKLSTEKMSEEILNYINKDHQEISVSVKVMEDDYNGSETHRSK